MKKIAILLVLLAAAGLVYGQATISGSATTEFGIQLVGGEIIAGFKADSSTNISLTVAEAEGSTSSEDEWYGLVELTGASIAWNSDGIYDGWDAKIGKDLNDDGDFDDDGETEWINSKDDWGLLLPFKVTAPSIAARITNGTIYIQLQSQPGFAYTNAADEEADEVESTDDTGVDPIDDFTADRSDIGISIGYDSDMVDVVFEIVSNQNWEDAQILENSGWGVGLGVDVAVAEGIDVSFGVAAIMNSEYVYAVNNNNEIGIALGVDAVVAMATIDFGVDGILDLAAETTQVEATLGVDLDFAPLTVSVGGDFITNITSAATVISDVDAMVGISVDLTPITLGVDVKVTDIIVNDVSMDEMDYEVAVNAGYSEGIVTASVTGAYKVITSGGTAADAVLDLVIDLDFAVLDNTSVGIMYDLDELTLDGADEDYGNIVLSTTLTY